MDIVDIQWCEHVRGDKGRFVGGSGQTYAWLAIASAEPIVIAGGGSVRIVCFECFVGTVQWIRGEVLTQSN